MPEPSLAGVGIDILSLKRAKHLIQSNSSSRLRRFLSAHERRRHPALTPLIFAKLFTAKEAFFKASQGAWLGPHGWAALEVIFLPGHRFQVKSLNSVLNHPAPAAEGCFFRCRSYVGAQIILWKNSYKIG